jgi:hypothetical protein
VQSFGGALVIGQKEFINAPSGLVVDKNGTPVGVSTAADMKADDSWKGSPLQWPQISAADMAQSLKTLDARTAKSIVKVMLNFRSPKNGSAEAAFRQPGDATVQYVLGVITDDKNLLILADLKPTVTARLERIKVFTDPPIEATFKASLKDYGAFVATLEKPVTGGVGISKATVQSLKTVAIPSAEIYLLGDKHLSYFQPRRIAGYSLGWRRNVYPELTGETRGLFLFDPAGDMLALPIAQREKASTQEGRYSQSQWLVTPIAQIEAAIADPNENTDPGNIPLTEEQENRLAWVGFEMQPMNPELARANNVSDQTNDGETGALLTYVYPDSPDAKAGVEPGWVLLRIDAEDQPKPIDVRVAADPFSERPFPWDRYNEVSEAYFDRVLELSPWPRAENSVVRTVTDLGFGKKYTMEFFHDGKVDKKTFTVTEGPPHFSNAPKYKDAGLGMTVKDLTYEVRRYMQKKSDDPGVIIGRIEPGSRASKAGLKPYEVITHVNDHPVMNVKDFEKEMKGQTEVRLSVKRMTQGRIVKITLAEGAAGEGTKPAATAPAEKE